MTKPSLLVTLGLLSVTTILAGERDALADEATIGVAAPPERGSGDGSRFVEPPPSRLRADDGLIAREPELYRSFLRLTLGPTALTTGKGLGYGVGLGADMGQGSVGARLSAAWLRGEGKNGDGTSTPTGDSIGIYSGEITLDLNKRGRLHPVIGMGAGVLHVSRPDQRSGFAGVGTGRFALEYALALDDADVRVGANVLGGLVGPIADEIRGLRGYVQSGVHLAIGF